MQAKATNPKLYINQGKRQQPPMSLNNKRSYTPSFKPITRISVYQERLLMWMHERNTIKLHVQLFLKTNTWMFETCRIHYNYIKTL